MRHWVVVFVLLCVVGSVAAADKCLHFYSPLVPTDSKDPVLHHLEATGLENGAGIHPYFEQKAIATGRNDVKISYYKRDRSVLAIITNLGKTPYEKTVRLDLKALGLDAAKVKIELLDEDPKTRPEGAQWAGKLMRKELLLENGTLKLTIPPHDFRMIEVRQAAEEKAE